MSDDFASVDAYIAGLEDASGIVEAIQAHLAPCPDCDASGYATTYDGRTLGVCSTCNGFGGRHLAALSSVPDVPAARDEQERWPTGPDLPSKIGYELPAEAFESGPVQVTTPEDKR